MKEFQAQHTNLGIHFTNWSESCARVCKIPFQQTFRYVWNATVS